MLDRSSHAFIERLFGYEGAAWGPRYTTENFLPRLRGNAASAIAAPAKDRCVPQTGAKKTGTRRVTARPPDKFFILD